MTTGTLLCVAVTQLDARLSLNECAFQHYLVFFGEG
jgi:hypothetical protein